MAFVLRPSRFISINSCKSFPLSNRGPPPSQDRPVHTLVWGWGIFNRLYGDFCTGADSKDTKRRLFHSSAFFTTTKLRISVLLLGNIGSHLDISSVWRQHQ